MKSERCPTCDTPLILEPGDVGYCRSCHRSFNGIIPIHGTGAGEERCRCAQMQGGKMCAHCLEEMSGRNPDDWNRDPEEVARLEAEVARLTSTLKNAPPEPDLAAIHGPQDDVGEGDGLPEKMTRKAFLVEMEKRAGDGLPPEPEPSVLEIAVEALEHISYGGVVTAAHCRLISDAALAKIKELQGE